MATALERDLLASAVLAPLGREATRLPVVEITGFLAMVGHLYDGGLMVIGRAVNGWETEILPGALTSTSSVESYADSVFKSVIGTGRLSNEMGYRLLGQPREKLQHEAFCILAGHPRGRCGPRRRRCRQGHVALPSRVVESVQGRPGEWRQSEWSSPRRPTTWLH